MAVYIGNSNAGRVGDRETPGADFPVSLAEVINSSFSERPCLYKIRWNVSEEDI